MSGSLLASTLALALVIGCSTGGPAVAPPPDRVNAAHAALGLRSRTELVRAVEASLASLPAQPSEELPRLGEPSFLLPPREAEVGWIDDPAIPLAERLGSALTVSEGGRTILQRYVARDAARRAADPARASDSAESLLWVESVVRVFGRLATALVVEFLPTLSPADPTYATRVAGLDKMRDGAMSMLRGGLGILQAQEVSLAERRRVSGAWRAYADRYARLWDAPRCAVLAPLVRGGASAATDRSIADDLGALATALDACAQRAAP
jgi:hypothetical protein